MAPDGESNTQERRLAMELKEAGRDGNWFKAQMLLGKYTGCAMAVFTAALGVAHRCGRYREGAKIYEKFRSTDGAQSSDAALQAEAIQIFTKLRCPSICVQNMATCGAVSSDLIRLIRSSPKEAPLLRPSSANLGGSLRGRHGECFEPWIHFHPLAIP